MPLRPVGGRGFFVGQLIYSLARFLSLLIGGLKKNAGLFFLVRTQPERISSS